MSSSDSTRPFDVATVASIAIVAFGLQSVVHEVLGHTVTAWLTGAKVVLISSTAMQTEGGSKLVPASGPLCNLLFGAVAYFIFRTNPRFTAGRLFLWIFAFANLFLGTGYILYSGMINFGDSAIVIAGLRPAWLYRLALIGFGAWGYRYCLRLAAGDLLGLVRGDHLTLEDVPQIVYPACIAGVVLYIVASLFNPISPSLIFYDGVSEALGVALGFLPLAAIVRSELRKVPSRQAPEPSVSDSIPRSLAWIVFGSIFGVLFVAAMGRGIRLH